MATALEFKVNSRTVGTNPGDPNGLRRSQRAVFALAAETEASVIAFHGPTGAGKSHILREIAKDNALSAYPRRLVFTFPIHALVNQQAVETSSNSLDPQMAFELLKVQAKAAPEGPEAKALNRFMSTCVLPEDFKNSAMVLELLKADARVPLALTPDSFDLVVKGILTGLAQPVNVVRVRDLIEQYLPEKMTREIAVKKITVAAAPWSFGPKTEGRIREILRTVVPANTLPMADRNKLVRELVEATRPEDPTPGPKYRYSPDAAAALKDGLQGALIVFDEYHLLARFPAFRRMINRLLILGARILLMSGTPRRDFLENWDTRVVDFDEAESHDSLLPMEPVVAFNHPMQVRLQAESFRSYGYDSARTVKPLLQQWDKQAPGPCVVILESVERALRLRVHLSSDASLKDRLMLWTGPEKDPRLHRILGGEGKLAMDAIVIGTSALELGVDLPFRNLVTEALYHDALMQRIGRIGRMGSYAPGQVHHVVVLVNRSVLDGSELPHGIQVERTEMGEVLAKLLKLPPHRRNQDFDGLWLRGDRQFQMLAVVPDGKGGYKSVRGAETLLRIYPPAQGVGEWGRLAPHEKRNALVEQLGLSGDEAFRVIFGEHYNPCSVAYLATGGSVLQGAIKHEDSLTPNRKWTSRRWLVGGKTVMEALIRTPKDQGDPGDIEGNRFKKRTMAILA